MNKFIPSDFRPDYQKEPEGFKNFKDPYNLFIKIIPESKMRSKAFAWLWWSIFLLIIVISFTYSVIEQMHF